MPKITFCLLITTFTMEQCNKIQCPVFQATLPRLGLNRNFPRAVIYGPTRFGGLAFPHLYTEQGLLHLKWLIFFARNMRQTSTLFNITLRHTQLEAGIGVSIMKLNPKLSYLTESWLTHTISFLHQNEISLILTTEWIPPIQREHDLHIMDLMLDFQVTPKELLHINQCRLYLQVYLLSDIFTANGKEVDNWVTNSSSNPRRSTWRLPAQQKPSNHSWNIWKTALKNVLYHQKKLKYQLGQWQRILHQRWPGRLIYPQVTQQFILPIHPSSFQSYLQSVPKYQTDIHDPHLCISDNIATQLLFDLYAGKVIGANSSTQIPIHRLFNIRLHHFIQGRKLSHYWKRRCPRPTIPYASRNSYHKAPI